MTRKTIYIAALVAVGLCLGGASTSSAHQLNGAPKYRPGVHDNLYTPQGQPLTRPNDQYRYVVPSTPRQGAFYNYENGNYYTPPSLRRDGQTPLIQRPVAMEFGSSKHLVELAERIETLSNELCLDLHHNYKHNPRFKEVYSESYQLLQAAKFIRARENQGNREAIGRTASQIDKLFHHLQGALSGFQRQENRRIGQLGLEAKTEELQAMIHHLLFDQGIKPNHDRGKQVGPDAAGIPGTREDAPPPRP